jgi:nitronate monooxygenase
MAPEALREVTARMQAATNQPFNLNFFTHSAPEADPGRLADAIERLRPYYAELGLGAPPSELPTMGPGFDVYRGRVGSSPAVWLVLRGSKPPEFMGQEAIVTETRVRIP